jgi:hypothetical protein
MVSRLRRSLRAYLSRLTTKGRGTRIKRGMPERGRVVADNWISKLAWQVCHVDSLRLPVVVEIAPGFTRSYSLPQNLPELCFGAASKRAEKSRLTRRRKRGLRTGKGRSRGRHPRRSPPERQPLPKSPNPRQVNHMGRKYIWAVVSSNKLRKDCEKFNKFPRGESVSPQIHTMRLRMKRYCMCKWQRLHDRAEACGIPPSASFHATFWKYLLVETSRGDRAAGWDFLLAGLPGDPSLDETPRGPRRFDSRGSSTGKRPITSSRGRPLRRR